MNPVKFLQILPMIVAAYAISTQSALAGNMFKDLWGVVTDPLKLKQSSQQISDSIERSLVQLASLEGVTNAHAQERLEQIRSIAREALSGSADVIAQAASHMSQLENKINEDAIKFLYKAQCQAEIVATDTMQRSFELFISKLIQARPHVKIFGVTVAAGEFNNITITNADQAYISTRDAVIEKLKSDINDNSKAYEILSSYQNIELGAKYARCHYIGQALDVKFVQEVNEWERRSIPWITAVNVKM